MTLNLLLSQLKGSNKFVNSFKVKDNTLIIVENASLLKFKFNATLNETSKITEKRISGYIVAAFQFQDLLNAKDYLILVKEVGNLEIWDSEFKLIDSLDTGYKSIDLSQFNLFLGIDYKLNRLYINLSEYRIYVIELDQTKDSITFKRNKNIDELACFYESKDKIYQFESSLEIDYTVEKEYFSLTILTCNESEFIKSFGLINIKILNKAKSLLYDVIVNQNNLKFDSRNPILKVIPGFAICIISNSSIFIIEHLIGIQHVVDGKSLESNPLFHIQQDGNIVPNIVAFKDSEKIFFRFITDKMEIWDLTMNLIYEDGDIYSFHWSSLQVESKKLDSKFISMVPIDSLIMKFCFLVNEDYDLILFDLFSLSQVSRLRSYLDNKYCIFDAQLIGYNSKVQMSCGGTGSNEGIIEIEYTGFNDLFSNIEPILTTANVKRFWDTNHGVYYLDETLNLRNNGKIIMKNEDVIYVTKDEKFITRKYNNDIILEICGIENSMDYAYIDINGVLKLGGNSKKSLKLDIDGEYKFVKFILFAKMIDSNIYVVIAYENNILIVKNFEIEFLRTSVKNIISDIIILRDKDHELQLLISDIFGNLQIRHIKDQNQYIDTVLKLTNNKLKLLLLNCNSNILGYSDDICVMMRKKSDEFEIHKVHTPVSFDKVTLGVSGEMFLETPKGNIFKLKNIFNTAEKCMPTTVNKKNYSKTHDFIKFITLPSSLKYSICCGIKNEFNKTLEKEQVYYELLLIDNDTLKVEDRFDISKKFPYTKISDITAVPFDPDDETTAVRLSYAKQLMLSKCFVVSLDLESVDDESMPNFLLFSLDEKNLTIDLHTSMSTSFNITSLKNYINNSLLVGGETLQVYDIDYLVKDNAFKITLRSNSLYPNAFITNMTYIPGSKIKSNIEEHSISNISHNLLFSCSPFEGVKENIIIKRSDNTYVIKPIIGSSKLNPISTAEKNTLLMSATSFIDNGTVIFIGVLSPNILLVSLVLDNNEIANIKVRLPYTIISVKALDDYRKSANGNNKTIMKDGKYSDLFLISTICGGIFLIRKFSDFSIFDEETNEFIRTEMDGIMQDIGYESNSDEILLLDMRTKQKFINDL
ncbi:hypothetical protein Kpol_1073p29 [Vanderwaltozyma polyspora DSM 70294]|uniref:Cleavage/polyadenylation specificity factor A subunit N-terminal domain-containing protein n=1 Tax=Vanderwaltozyma polyspora (strain ATCC 22028 / DSM 70294 / BCRC 21397 / CBS 2163 / NBRC 10782 / NRRL Y-8283 / UCD 57-17) TaxID=436907 RepID=A7TPU0_VANPO|nr:uncharacterized protein Kpol_1073p29 [Vanderwaltozyma polyspora DSM 70294]EDO15741.1 hypothetical protein Kpol_1073p29 [Vanderwaltozyma polyspora DSM 70294]